MEASAIKKKFILNKPSSYKGGHKSQNSAKTEICITIKIRLYRDTVTAIYPHNYFNPIVFHDIQVHYNIIAFFQPIQ